MIVLNEHLCVCAQAPEKDRNHHNTIRTRCLDSRAVFKASFSRIFTTALTLRFECGCLLITTSYWMDIIQRNRPYIYLVRITHDDSNVCMYSMCNDTLNESLYLTFYFTLCESNFRHHFFHFYSGKHYIAIKATCTLKKIQIKSQASHTLAAIARVAAQSQ